MHNLFPSLTASCLSLPLSLCLLCATGAMLDRSTAVPCRFPCPWLGFNCLGFMLGQAVCDTHSLVGLIVTMTFKLLSLSHTHTLCLHCLSFFGFSYFPFTGSLHMSSNQRPINKSFISKALVLIHYCQEY